MPCSATVLSREAWPETIETSRAWQRQRVGEQLDDRRVRLAVLGRRRDAHLPGRRRGARRRTRAAPRVTLAAAARVDGLTRLRLPPGEIAPGQGLVLLVGLGDGRQLRRLGLGLRLGSASTATGWNSRVSSRRGQYSSAGAPGSASSCRRRLRLLDHAERRAQQRLDAPRLGEEPLPLGLGGARDRASLAVGLGDDQLGLALRRLLGLDGRALGRDERRRQQRLALLDLVERLLDLVAACRSARRARARRPRSCRRRPRAACRSRASCSREQRAPELHVPQFNRCVTHASPPPSAAARESRSRCG